MKSFRYTITDEIGIHARPAGQLVKEAKKYASRITIMSGGKQVEATKLMALMALAVKGGETIEVCAEGSDEEEAVRGMRVFLEQNL